MRTIFPNFRLVWHRAIGLVAISFALLGCGSGGGSGPIANCDLDTFTPSYTHQLAHLFNWASFPVKVFFVRNAQFTDARRLIARTGFDQWVNATGGKLTYTEVSSAETSQITVTFDPATADGLTTSHFSGLELTRAEVSLGVKNQLDPDLQCVAAHEFGHAMGIDGHSDDAADLMYSIHFIGHPCAITNRDLNTVKTGYCRLFGRCVAVESRAAGGLTGTVTRK